MPFRSRYYRPLLQILRKKGLKITTFPFDYIQNAQLVGKLCTFCFLVRISYLTDHFWLHKMVGKFMCFTLFVRILYLISSKVLFFTKSTYFTGRFCYIQISRQIAITKLYVTQFFRQNVILQSLLLPLSRQNPIRNGK